MKRNITLSIAVVGLGMISFSCERGNDSCVEINMEEGLNQSDAEDKCDEELVETVVILDELK